MVAVEQLLQMQRLIKDGNLAGIQDFIAKLPDVVREISPASEITWLHYAVRFKHPELVPFFHEQGISVNTKDPHGATPLSDAVKLAKPELIQWLLDRGADPTVSHWPMINAVTGGNLDIVKLLVEHGASTDFEFGDPPRTPLAQAREFKREEVEEYLSSLAGDFEEDVVMAEMADDDEDPFSENWSLQDEIKEFFEMQSNAPILPLGLQEIIPGQVGISVWTIARQDSGDPTVLFTTGMSDKPMTVPEGNEQFQYAEMVMLLPPDWPIQPDIPDRAHSWPWIWLRTLAHYPHESGGWYGDWTTTFSNDDPPQPLDSSCKFVGFLLLMNFGEFAGFEAEDGRFINLITAMPLYAEELTLAKSDDGIRKVMERFRDRKLHPHVKLKRPNVAAKK